MSIQITDAREPGFFIIDNEVIDDYELSPQEGWLYTVIVRHADRSTRECFPSIATLARKAGMTEPTVSKYLNRLEKKGLISRKSGQKAGVPNVYTIMPIRRGTKEFSTPHKTPLDPGTKEFTTNKTQSNKTQEQENPSDRPTPAAGGDSAPPATVAPSAQGLADPQPEREKPRPEQPDDPKPSKPERDAVYDALAEHLLGLVPRSDAARSQNWLLGPMTGWCFGSTVTVRADGKVHKVPGCAHPVSADLIPQFVRQYRREHPSADLPTTLAGFIKHFSIWLDKQAHRPTPPPALVMSDEDYARTIQRQILGGEVAS